MGKLSKKEMPIWAKLGHKKPTTRREFLGYGMIPFAARAFLPSALGSLFMSPEAYAAQCSSSANAMVPFITLNLAGGASISSNFVPFDQGGQPLTSYTKMGLGNNTGANALAFTSEMGVNQWSTANGQAIGQLLVGIRSTADAATLANTAVVAVCVSSQDDTASNKFDVSGLVAKAGLAGSLIPNLGTRASATGLGQMPSFVTPPPPLIVRSFTDIQNSIRYTGALGALTPPQRTQLAGLVSSLSTSQAKKLAQLNSTRQIQSLVECAGIKNIELSNGAPVDPLANAQVATAWGINAGTGANNESRVFASMVYNGLLGQAGSINLERGGYDYHDGTRTTGDTRDREAGAVIGRVLSTARILGKRAMMYVTSDGSVVSQETATPGGNWTSDRGGAGMALMFFFDPTGRPATKGSQVGYYNNGQAVDERFIVGNSPELAAQAVFANWAQFNRNLNLFSKVIPGNSALGSALDTVVKVA